MKQGESKETHCTTSPRALKLKMHGMLTKIYDVYVYHESNISFANPTPLISAYIFPRQKLCLSRRNVVLAIIKLDWLLSLIHI